MKATKRGLVLELAAARARITELEAAAARPLTLADVTRAAHDRQQADHRPAVERLIGWHK